MPQGGSARCQLWTSKNGFLVKSDGKQAQLSHPPPPPSQTGLHHLSQCCLGCLDQGLSYPVQLSYTVPPFKILERYWLEGRRSRPSSSDLGMHLLSNLGRCVFISIVLHCILYNFYIIPCIFKWHFPCIFPAWLIGFIDCLVLSSLMRDVVACALTCQNLI